MISTLVTDDFADDERRDATASRPRALVRTQIESLPLWKTRLRVVITHTNPDAAYVETYEGPLGNIASYGNSVFRICIGGDGRHGDGKWINLLRPALLAHYKISVFEVVT
jgi:hypothetical protein